MRKFNTCHMHLVARLSDTNVHGHFHSSGVRKFRSQSCSAAIQTEAREFTDYVRFTAKCFYFHSQIPCISVQAK